MKKQKLRIDKYSIFPYNINQLATANLFFWRDG